MKPMSESKSTNWFFISSIICKVTGDRKFSQQKVLSFPLRFASFHPSNAFSSAIWSLHKFIKILRNKISHDKKIQNRVFQSNLQESPANDLFASSASSFLFIGRTNGSRCASADAMVNAGFKHLNMEPMRSIFPI